MKKLHTLAFYALVTPVITLSAGSVLAQQSSTQQEREQMPRTQQQQSSQQSGQQAGQPATQSATQEERNRATATGSATTSAGSSQSTPAQPRSQTGAATSTTRTDTATTQRSATGAAASSGTARYLSAAPANGMHVGKIMGAEVRSTGDENVGEVNDLIIDQEGQIVAVVVGVGGFLGIGQKDVAIEWDQVARAPGDDRDTLRVNVTREALESAPEYRPAN